MRGWRWRWGGAKGWAGGESTRIESLFGYGLEKWDPVRVTAARCGSSGNGDREKAAEGRGVEAEMEELRAGWRG